MEISEISESWEDTGVESSQRSENFANSLDIQLRPQKDHILGVRTML